MRMEVIVALGGEGQIAACIKRFVFAGEDVERSPKIASYRAANRINVAALPQFFEGGLDFFFCPINPIG
jgi:hypothetical protein